jgi:hypothetical protein
VVHFIVMAPFHVTLGALPQNGHGSGCSGNSGRFSAGLFRAIFYPQLFAA